jgi:hypothetical protein
MGNCECLPVSECKDCVPVHSIKTETLRLIKDDPSESSKTSLVSLSRMTLSNLSQFQQ